MGNPVVGALYLLLGVLQAATAIQLGWMGFPFAWLGVSCLLVGIAYSLGAPQLLGKCEDGRIRREVHLLALPFFALCEMVSVVRRFGPEPRWNEITPGLYIGRRVRVEELPPGVDSIVDLTVEFSADDSIRDRFMYRALPTLDGCASEPKAFRESVASLAQRSGTIFVHCAVGHGRSACFVAGILLRRGVVSSVAQAEAAMQKSRPRVRLTATQRALLEESLLLWRQN